MEFDEFRKLSPAEMAAAMAGPIARAKEKRLALQRTTPRVARFASTFATTGRWIDFGLRYAQTAEVLSWSASVQSWEQTLSNSGFFDVSNPRVSICEASSFGDVFDEQQIERIVIFSDFGATAASHAYQLWKSALVSSLGLPDITKIIDLSYLALPFCELLVWDSNVARASLGMTDHKDSPIAEFRLRHKLVSHLEEKRGALIATGNYERFDL